MEGVRGASLIGAALTLATFAGTAHANSLTGAPAKVTFPDTGTGSTSAAKTVTFTNTSNNQVSISSLTIAGAHPGDFTLVNPPTFPLSLGPGAPIPVDVAFAPTNGGLRSAILQATVLNEVGTADVTLEGNGLGPRVTVMPTPLNFKGLPFGQQPPPISATVSNGGGSVLRVSGVTLAGPDAAQFSLGGLPGLPITLGPMMSFPFSLTFTPIGPGQATATLNVTSDDPNTPLLSVPINGYSGDPVIALDVGTVIFGNQLVGVSSSPQDITVSNKGFSDLVISGMSITGTEAGDFSFTTSLTFPTTIPVGGSVKFAVGFAPRAVGSRSGQVQILSNDPVKPTRAISMSGVGTTPMASIMPNKIDFGMVRVGSTGKSPLSITNKGTGPVQVTSLSVSGADSALFTTSLAAPFTVAANTTTIVQVNFKPTAIASAMATLNLVTDDANLPMFSVPLTGSGISPIFTVSPTSLDFGGVRVGDMSMAKSFSLGNNGNQVLNVTSFLVAGAGLDQYTVTPMLKTPAMIMPGAKLMFDVVYAPIAAQADNAQINIAVDDPKMPMATVALKGFGLQPVLKVDPAPDNPLDFGSVNVGGKKGPLPVTIQNTGGATLHISTVKIAGMMAGAFSIDKQGPIDIEPSMDTTIGVSFSPREVGDYSGMLQISSSDMGIAMAAVGLAGKGVSSLVTATPSLYDFGAVAVSSTSEPDTIRIHYGCQQPDPPDPNKPCVNKNPIQIDRVVSEDPHFVVDTSMMVPTLQPGDGTSITVTFAPDGEGMVGTQIKVFLVGTTVPAARVTVTGAGVQPKEPSGCAVRRSGRPASWGMVALMALALGALRRPRASRRHRG